MTTAPTSYGELARMLEALPMLVRETRRRRSLSVRAAAAEAGLGFSTISRVENGKGVTLEHAVQLVRWIDR